MGNGKHYCLNVPLKEGISDDQYLYVFKRFVISHFHLCKTSTYVIINVMSILVRFSREFVISVDICVVVITGGQKSGHSFVRYSWVWLYVVIVYTQMEINLFFRLIYYATSLIKQLNLACTRKSSLPFIPMPSWSSAGRTHLPSILSEASTLLWTVLASVCPKSSHQICQLFFSAVVATIKQMQPGKILLGWTNLNTNLFDLNKKEILFHESIIYNGMNRC